MPRTGRVTSELVGCAFWDPNGRRLATGGMGFGMVCIGAAVGPKGANHGFRRKSPKIGKIGLQDPAVTVVPWNGPEKGLGALSGAGCELGAQADFGYRAK